MCVCVGILDSKSLYSKVNDDGVDRSRFALTVYTSNTRNTCVSLPRTQ